MTTAGVTKFKPITVFHADVENLESNYNCKETLLIKISSSIHCKRPTLNDDSSFKLFILHGRPKLDQKKTFY